LKFWKIVTPDYFKINKQRPLFINHRKTMNEKDRNVNLIDGSILITIRKKIFFAYALPHFCWLFSTWFYFTEKQKHNIEHIFCSGIRLVYSLKGWDDITTMVLSKEKSIYDYIFSYWSRLSFHLERAADALSFQQSWQAYNIVISRNKTWLRSMGFRKNSKFPLRLAERARHTLVE
jgi:hypothetical protein